MDFKNKIMKKAFSLIELIVWITISMILMISIGVFVSSWMENIFLQQSSIKNASDLNNFAKDLYSTFSYLENTWSIHKTNSRIIFKRKTEFDKWWFTYIWVSTEDEFYCFSWSEDTNTDHIFIKNFIPFVEDWENIEDFEDILTWSINHDWIDYYSYQKEHKITNQNWDIIVWKWIFWDFFEEWVSWTWIYLNSPTWLASDSEVIYISDTLNDRVLYLSWWLIYKLLDENDWLKEPTGLYYENNELYISNSWKWEVLKYSSEITSAPDTTLYFSEVDESGVEKIYIDFFKDWVDYDINSVNIKSISNLSYNNYNISYTNNSLSYTFMSWSTSEPQDFDSWTTYNIELSNLTNFLENWNYTIQLQIDDTKLDYYFFTQWDEKIYTKNDNALVVMPFTNLKYPTFIKGSSASDITDFDLNSIWDLKLDKNNDIFLKTPIEKLDISENSELINIILKYYKNYNCYNLDQNEQKIRTFLSKININ